MAVVQLKNKLGLVSQAVSQRWIRLMSRKSNNHTSYGSNDSSLVKCSICGNNYDSLEFDSCPSVECRANGLEPSDRLERLYKPRGSVFTYSSKRSR